MAHAMAKVVALLCMLLLIAQVDSARLLKQADVMTAETHSTEESTPSPVDEASQFEAIPPPETSDDSYNYNQDTTDAEFAAEEVLFENPSSPGTSPETATDVFTTEDSFAQDQGTPEEGTLVGGPSFAAEGFSVDDTVQGTDKSTESKPYVYDATTQDVDAVLPGQGGTFQDDNAYSFSDAVVQDTTYPDGDFVYDESTPGFGN